MSYSSLESPSLLALPSDLLTQIASHCNVQTTTFLNAVTPSLKTALSWKDKFALHFPHILRTKGFQENTDWKKAFKHTFAIEYKGLTKGIRSYLPQ